MITHPMRDEEINAWEPISEGMPYLAFIGDGNKYCIIFRGETEHEARFKAEEFKTETISKYEDAYIARKQAAIERSKKKKQVKP